MLWLILLLLFSSSFSCNLGRLNPWSILEIKKASGNTKKSMRKWQSDNDGINNDNNYDVMIIK